MSTDLLMESTALNISNAVDSISSLEDRFDGFNWSVNLYLVNFGLFHLIYYSLQNLLVQFAV